MTRRKSDDLRVRGMGIAARFALAMSLALAGVMSLAGVFLFKATSNFADSSVKSALQNATFATAESEGQARFRTLSDMGRALDRQQRVLEHDVEFTGGKFEGERGVALSLDKDVILLVPDSKQENPLTRLFIGVTLAVVLAGAGVALVVATQVSKPLGTLIDDVRAIARGNLMHGVRARGGSGEVALLARTIGRMGESLAEAQEAEIELGVREREGELAQEVRDALLSATIPELPGYEFADDHIGAPEPGGDFHFWVEREGKVVVVVCEVSGQGVPGALVGAMARAYLKSEIERATPLGDALRKVNREIAGDVRRGMYVTALCLEFDPEESVAFVACAGHKLPVVRYEAAASAIRTIQPSGIALGFDKGPIFDRSLELLKIPFEPGDRLVIANTGAVRVTNEAGEELGEKALYVQLRRAASGGARQIIDHLAGALEDYAGEEPFPADVSLVVCARDEFDGLLESLPSVDDA